jgi:hypothetical protein
MTKALATALTFLALASALPAGAETIVQMGGQVMTLPDPPGLQALRNRTSGYYRRSP